MDSHPGCPGAQHHRDLPWMGDTYSLAGPEPGGLRKAVPSTGEEQLCQPAAEAHSKQQEIALLFSKQDKPKVPVLPACAVAEGDRICLGT